MNLKVVVVRLATVAPIAAKGHLRRADDGVDRGTRANSTSRGGADALPRRSGAVRLFIRLRFHLARLTELPHAPSRPSRSQLVERADWRPVTLPTELPHLQPRSFQRVAVSAPVVRVAHGQGRRR